MVEAVVAGHICLDILPDLSAFREGTFDRNFQPGRLIHTGPARISTGGTVSNTGQALHQLGIQTRLLARVGADQFGMTIREILAARDPSLAEGITAHLASSTSYSIVISPPGNDRRFLHHPGSNDDFSAEDVQVEQIRDARLFHFGYPPLMAGMFADNGAQLVALFQKVKSLGLTTSLDMAFPDPASAAGKVDWRSILQKTLPYVDIFTPSLDEILFMLKRDSSPKLTREFLREVSGELLAMGAKMVLLKLGDKGLYLHAGSADKLVGFGRACPSNLSQWSDFEAWSPCYRVEVAGTTGAGDATVAGFLAALLRDLSPADALNAGLAVGACCVERPDPLSGILPWDDTWQRIQSGWPKLENEIA